MHISVPFIRRPVATSLLTAAILLAGGVAYRFLPVAPLPQVDFPTIQIHGSLPGASPETLASAVATPLERQFGRIAGVTEMTSSSQLGTTNITLQFDLNRNIDAASRDVQAAINAAAGQLPSDMPSLPTFKKADPSDTPIIVLSLLSDTVPLGPIYDVADSIIAQKLSQISGVGQINIGGSSQPAVRIDLNPMALAHYGIGLEDVRHILQTANANSPKGSLSDQNHRWVISASDQLLDARLYRSLIVAYRNGAPVRLSDVGEASDGLLDVRNTGFISGKPAVFMGIIRQPGANIIATAERVYALLPELRASIPPSIKVDVVGDRTVTVRSSVKEIQFTLLLTVMLVVMVIFIFLRSVWATVIPSIAVPLSLVGTFGVMYLLGYSIDNLSLLALAISTGFVVDDAIVVIENIARYLETGLSPIDAAIEGTREIGFTGNRFHRAVDEHFAGGRVHSHFNDGRADWPLVSGICGDLEYGDCRFFVRFPDHDSDDVRPISETAIGAKTRQAISCDGSSLPADSQPVCIRIALGAASPAVDAFCHWRHILPECLFICRDSERLRPPAGHWAVDGNHHWRRGHVVPNDAGEDEAISTNPGERPGNEIFSGLQWRRSGEHRQCQDRVDPTGGAQGRHGSDYRASEAETCEGSGSHIVSAGRSGCPNRRADGQFPVSIHARRRKCERTRGVVAASDWRAAAGAGLARYFHRPTGSRTGSHPGRGPRHSIAIGNSAAGNR